MVQVHVPKKYDHDENGNLVDATNDNGGAHEYHYDCDYSLHYRVSTSNRDYPYFQVKSNLF